MKTIVLNKCVITLVAVWLVANLSFAGSPITGLLERIDKGASQKFKIEQTKSDTDFFELDQDRGKVVVRGNNYVSIATGINWYLKYYAGIHLSWNGMKARLPEVLPPVGKKERHETDLKLRYSLNYCTFSYSMAFWDWDRWEQEIDWMALHGINMPLAIVGTAAVWKNILLKLGYNQNEINEFIAGPAFQPWWLMNNLEGWGGPNTESWYENQISLQKKILKRMREFGIEPVLPGYSGMVPNDAKEKLGLDVVNPGLWCGFRRPAILQPTDKNFPKIAELYYKELTRLYGKAKYYSMDPFHEGGSTEGMDLDAAGKVLLSEMKKINPEAVWVAQAWQKCPHEKMIENLPEGDLIVLDLFSESRPQWGDSQSTWYRENGFGQHGWIYCMLLNFGANIGLHGKMEHVINEFNEARDSRFNKTLKGVGMSPEGIENNPVMFELLTELPWRSERFSKNEWLYDYVKARYGKSNEKVQEAWKLLSNTIYNCPVESTQEGPYESVLTARPSLDVVPMGHWEGQTYYYKAEDIFNAARTLVEVADEFRGNNNFEYDLVDVVRQAISEKARLVYNIIVESYEARDKKLLSVSSDRFLELIVLQDKLLSTRTEFCFGKWISSARTMGETEEEKDWYEWNARVLVTTWGDRTASDVGLLRDYAQRENHGLLKDFYYMRWNVFFDYLKDKLNGLNPAPIDYYSLEEEWTKQHNVYSEYGSGDVVDTVKEVFSNIDN